MLGMWIRIFTRWDKLSVRAAPAQYENIHWIIAGWSPKIHKVLSDRSTIARETVPQLGMIVHITDMYLDTCCHDLGHTFVTCGSREVRNYTM